MTTKNYIACEACGTFREPPHGELISASMTLPDWSTRAPTDEEIAKIMEAAGCNGPFVAVPQVQLDALHKSIHGAMRAKTRADMWCALDLIAVHVRSWISERRDEEAQEERRASRRTTPPAQEGRDG